jgi:hypothetical protein
MSSNKRAFPIHRSGARRRPRAMLILLAGLLACALATFAGSAPAFASETTGEASWWQLTQTTRPAMMQPGSEAAIVVRAVDLGEVGVTSRQTPVEISDVLPANLTAVKATGSAGAADNETEGARGEFTCTLGGTVTCTWQDFRILQPFEEFAIYIKVKVEGALPGAENAASISGGESYRCVKTRRGAYDGPFCGFEEEATGDYEAELSGTPVPTVSSKRPVDVGSGETTFGLADLSVMPELEGGAPDTQAGSHPFQFSTTVAFNESAIPPRPESGPESGRGADLKPAAFPKDLRVNLPPGLVGNAQSIAQCTETQFNDFTSSLQDANDCPEDSAVGAAVVNVISFQLGGGTVPTTQTVPVFNLVPGPGEPARFGFEAVKESIVLDTSVRTGTDYGVVASISNISEFTMPTSTTLVLWGAPGNAAHRLARGWNCIRGGEFVEDAAPGDIPRCRAEAELNANPFLSLPTSCSGKPLSASAEVDSWQEPNKPPLVFEPQQFGNPMVSLDGCSQLPFAASISIAPDIQEASKPSGLNVHIHVPQEASLSPTGLAGADVKDTTVTLPEGVALNPAGANGLEACSESEVGYLGKEPGEPATSLFKAELQSPFCTDASKIGEVSIKTPLLANPLKGSVYLAAQNENPFGSLVAMYIVAEDPVSGVLVKLPGEVSLNQATGQITSTFQNTPQLPFEDLELHFFGGERAPLSTPAHCGTYTTQASFTPWSGNPPVSSSSSFAIDSGPGGGACPGAALPFSPSLAAGTTSNQAGGFTPLTTTISREDGQQNIQSVQLHMPAGLSGVLSGVKLCPEAQANAGTCGQESLIGSTIVSVGLGSDPYSVTGGEVFLTEGYEGAPFGLSIVNPAVAGPFNLGKVIVRAKIEVDPHTAALTITTGAIPHILDGIPLQIKHINVTISRNHFTFNPTNCNPLTLTGAVSSVEGASSPVSDAFQATNCASLKFAPKFAVSVGAKSSKPDGASLSVKLTYPTGAMGADANIAKVKVDLPKQLPSRLTTLQKACVAKVFEANPSNCPKESKVGSAKAITPILPVPLEGPAYFVSHGGEAFPSLIVVLKGYGVTVDLVGTTFISKAGITSSTFQQVPDVPVSSFELKLPTGKYSALAANLPAKDKRSFCGQTLMMPTAFVAQNGTEIHESTPIAVSGCPKAKKAKAKKKSKKAKKK